MSELVGLLDVGAATGSQFVRTLEMRGWVSRSLDAGDRRRHMVQITPKGQTVVNAAQVAQRQRLEQLLAHLSPPERSQLVTLTRKLANVVEMDTGRLNQSEGGANN
jgi:DNA-binding MarR family transcriptional regulator